MTGPVLVVEDDAAVREALGQTLELAGFQPHLASAFIVAKDHILIVNFPSVSRVSQLVRELQSDPQHSEREIVIVSDQIQELPFDDHLGGNARMVGARLPERVAAVHPVVTGERVHDGVLERMPHVQSARHVRWRNHDAISFF